MEQQSAVAATEVANDAPMGDETPSGATTSESGHLTRRYLRIKRRLRQLSLILKGLVGLALRFSGAAAGVALLILLGLEVTRHQVEIQPIAMPKSLIEAGYSPEVVARRLQDALDRLADAATTAGGKALPISMHGEAPEIVVPTVGVSLSTVATYLQRFLGYSPRTRITGEFTLSDPGVRLLLRLDGQVIFLFSTPADHIDDIWPKAADAVMREISPYRAALALYDSDPDEAIRLAESIIRRYPPGDENVAWARLIRGVRHFDALQYSAAEQEFRRVLRQEGGTSWASFWTPFSAPASYAEPAHFYLGMTLLSVGKTEVAYEEFSRAISLDPNDPGAHHGLGMTLTVLKRQADAAAEYDAVRRIYYNIFAGSADVRAHGPVSAPTHISFGNALFQQERNDYALEQFRWAVALDPGSDYGHRSVCDAQVTAKRLDEALSECRLAVKYAPKRVENHLSLAAVLLEKKDLEGARQTGQDALRLAPKSPLVQEMLGRIYKLAGEQDKALAAYREASRLAPEVAAYQAEIGGILRKEKKYDEAAEAYRKAVELIPASGSYRNALGNVFYEDNKFAEAADAYREAVKCAPDDVVIHRNLAGALAKQNDIDGAIRENQLAIKLKPDDAVSYNTLGNLYYEQRDYAAAIEAYKAALKLSPDSAVMHANLAGALAQQDDVDSAIREYQVAINLKPDNARSQNALGNLYFERKDYAAAAEAYNAALKLSPDNVTAHGNLSAVLREQGQFDAAVEETRKAIALAPNDAMAQNALGLALWSRNPVDPDALTAYRTAIALDPKDPDYYHNLATALEDHAAAVSGARRAELLLQACRALTEGLRQKPDDPYLQQDLTAIPSAQCDAASSLAKQQPTAQ